MRAPICGVWLHTTNTPRRRRRRRRIVACTCRCCCASVVVVLGLVLVVVVVAEAAAGVAAAVLQEGGEATATTTALRYPRIRILHVKYCVVTGMAVETSSSLVPRRDRPRTMMCIRVCVRDLTFVLLSIVVRHVGAN